MSDWVTPKDLLNAGNVPHCVLGGKTVRECWEMWREKWKRGEGTLEDLPYGPHHEGLWPPGWRPKGVRPAPMPAPDLAAELPQHLARCGVPDRLAAILCAGAKETPSVIAVREWLAADKSILLLHGDPNAGKSCAAASAFLGKKRGRWLDGAPEWNSAACAFIEATEIAGRLFDDATKEMLAALEGFDLVVLDELGVETMSAPWQSALDSLINKRFGNPKLRTILVTNVSAARRDPELPSPFEDRYGGRIARRVRESGTVLHALPLPRAQ